MLAVRTMPISFWGMLACRIALCANMTETRPPPKASEMLGVPLRTLDNEKLD